MDARAQRRLLLGLKWYAHPAMTGTSFLRTEIASVRCVVSAVGTMYRRRAPRHDLTG